MIKAQAPLGPNMMTLRDKTVTSLLTNPTLMTTSLSFPSDPKTF